MCLKFETRGMLINNVRVTWRPIFINNFSSLKRKHLKEIDHRLKCRVNGQTRLNKVNFGTRKKKICDSAKGKRFRRVVFDSQII